MKITLYPSRGANSLKDVKTFDFPCVPQIGSTIFVEDHRYKVSNVVYSVHNIITPEKTYQGVDVRVYID